MGAPLLWVNGRAADPSAPHLSALDRGFTLADGLFETVRVYGGTPFRLDRHLGRLSAGARVLALPLPATLPAMVNDAVRDARRAGLVDGALRITVSRGVGARGLAPAPDAAPTVVVAIHPIDGPPSPAGAPLAARVARARRNEHAATAGVKGLAYAEAIIALAEARAAGADEAIFLDTAGHVSEATASNLFAVVDGVLVTPPLSCGVLPGITREAVLGIAAAHARPAVERVLAPAELSAASEVFLTSSIREIAPVVRLDGRAIGTGVIGEVTRRVRDAYAALVREECGR
ncbi:MAG TPA: aminotransferase class IV [Gemmatimonadaceae bacterium]|nr:aminotransferase class IV [Gemmatimonadaceae bacterium]